MNIMELGALGEFVGSIGVILTLVYLAIQIRQNTAQQKQSGLDSRASTVNASAAALRDARRDIYQDLELSDIWLKGMSKPDELSEIEYLRYRLMIQNTVDRTNTQNSLTFLHFGQLFGDMDVDGKIKRVCETYHFTQLIQRNRP